MESKNNINPWIHIWVRPRRTFRSILERDPKRLVIWFAIISGILNTWLSFLWKSYPVWHDMPLAFSIPIIVILGGLIGWTFLYFGGWFYQLTGSWLGGQGTFVELKCAVGWAQYPFIVSSIFNVIGIFIMPTNYIQVLFGFLAVTTLIWGFIIFLKLLAEAHQFSFWKALLAFLIAIVLIFVLLMIVSLLIPLLSPLF